LIFIYENLNLTGRKLCVSVVIVVIVIVVAIVNK